MSPEATSQLNPLSVRLCDSGIPPSLKRSSAFSFSPSLGFGALISGRTGNNLARTGARFLMNTLLTLSLNGLVMSRFGVRRDCDSACRPRKAFEFKPSTRPKIE